jgi:hypothetical protein
VTRDGPVFIYRSLFGHRVIDLPGPRVMSADPGVWADLIRVEADGVHYQLYLLKDGPAVDIAIPHLQETPA